MTINLLPEELRGKEPEKKGSAIPESVHLEYKKPSESLEKKEEVKIEEGRGEGEEEIKSIKKQSSLFKVFKIFKSKPKIKPLAEKKASPEEIKEKPRSVEISLMPQELIIVKPVVREKIFVLMGILIIVFLLDFLFLNLVNWRYEQAKARIANLKAKISNLEMQTRPLLAKRDKIILLDHKAKRVGNILENHVYWTNFFAFLEEYTIPEVWFGDFAADTSGSFILPAQAKDLISVVRQVIILREAPFVKDVSVSGITIGDNSINFQLKLILDPKIFKK